MKLQVVDAASVVLALCAVALTGTYLAREFGQDREPQADDRIVVRKIRPTAELLRGESLGSSTASFAIVEFADFQCEFCAQARLVLEALRKKHPDDIRIVYHNLPLERVHPLARTAALAALCASTQGRFEFYHDLLYALQDSIGKITWAALAARAGVPNLPAFRACVEDRRYESLVERDLSLAARFGIRYTPTIIVGEDLIQGVPNAVDLEERLLSGRNASTAR